MLGSKLSILKKGMVLIGVPLLFQLGMLMYLFKVHADVADAERWEIHTKQGLEQASTLHVAVAEGHSAIRGLDVFRRADFEPEEREALTAVPELIQRLHEFEAGDPSQQARLDALQGVVGEYLAWAKEMQELARNGQWDVYHQRLQSLDGKRLSDAVEDRLDEFRRAEEELDRKRIAAAEDSREKQRIVVMAAAGATVLLAVGLMWAFAKGIGQRLAIATENARRMAQGQDLARPVEGSDELARLDAVLHDTAHRLAEAAARERAYTEELRHRGEELERINSDLVYKTQENETFVYSVSHDLRSPLVNLQGFTKELSHACNALREMLNHAQLPEGTRQQVDTIIDQDILLSVGFVQTAVLRSSNIIDALLRLSRAGRIEYQRQATDLKPIVDRIVMSMRVSADEKKARIEVKELPMVMADPTAIEQVLANLIGNAINYLDPRRQGVIEIGSMDGPADGARRATVYVKDNGMGIPAAYLSKLFVAFQRLHGDAAKGEGIGLALTKRIVDRHGGRVWAESTEGAGTTFYVSLPAADGAIAPGTKAR